MPPAIIGGVIAGAGAIGASVLSSKSNSKAIGQASDAQAEATREATQLQREARDQNVQFQMPLYNSGLTAMGYRNALLGLPGTPIAAPTPLPSTQPQQQSNVPGPNNFFLKHLVTSWQQKIASGQAELEDAPPQVRQYLQTAASPQTQAPTGNVPSVTQPTAQAAYDAFKASTGYQSRLTEANNGFNSMNAARGTLQSGAAIIARDRMNQDYASNEFGQYFGMLGDQQNLAAGAANALSGVNTNYANSAGNLAMQNGNNIANAAIASANNRNQLYGGIASGIGGIAGSIFGGSSFGGR